MGASGGEEGNAESKSRLNNITSCDLIICAHNF